MIQPTSQQAYFTEVLPTLADRHRKVLEVLSTVDEATNTELSRMLGWEINRVTPRVNELVNLKKPLIEQARKRPCKITGRTAIAWRVIRQPSKDPSTYCCKYCRNTATTFAGGSPRCVEHRVVVEQVSVF